ncbi:hypothetical protein [Hymenobacter ruricola]|uniref:Lipoprotein n=1 Tax=Hymenobacter ruricola TaxID=2791023 RepID=A0ABS0HYG5_9BACT|nr:hypothetical protein [Hymenobacter ruricola]MBF9219664.1 hypothetical protein [Hymenobacter ruricola]
MNTKLLGLLAAAALATAACTQDKPAAETAATNTVPSATENTAVVVPDTIAYRTDARHTADRVAQDLALTDETVKRRIENAYYTRASRLGELESRYATDTTGRYLAIREANDQTDEQIRTTLNNPEYYNTYSSNRASYGDGPYSLAPMVVTTTTTRRTGGVSQGTAIKKLEREGDGDKKTKYLNGAKVKRDDDGSVKIKRADGTKVKIDEDGNRTVKKSLFK